MKLIAFLTTILLTPLFFSQSECNNIDFESGNLDGWITSGNISIVNRDQQDEIGGFQTAKSGYYSVKLGSENSSTPSEISKSITVDNSNNYFIYSYAIVLVGVNHTAPEAAKVEVTVFDETNNPIPCASELIIASTNPSEGFLESSIEHPAGIPYYYLNWKTNAIDLSPYIGQNLVIKVKCTWCIYDIHTAYSYFDAYCSSDLISEYKDCESENYFIRTIDGFENYTWTGSGIVSGQGTNTIEVNQSGIYTVNIPNPNASCSDITLEIDANQNELPDIPIASFIDNGNCVSDTLFLDNTSSSISTIVSSIWYINSDTIVTIENQYISNNQTELYVQLIVENEVGCKDTISKIINLKPSPTLELGNSLTLCPDESIELYNTLDENTILTWSTGEVKNSILIDTEGEYTAMIYDGFCYSYDTIEINKNGQYLGIIPNVFTPNFDLKNDLYEIETEGLIDFNFKILNRWGIVVFATNSQPIKWDGIDNGNLIEEGVYAYLLEYNCNGDKKVKSGFIQLFY